MTASSSQQRPSRRTILTLKSNPTIAHQHLAQPPIGKTLGHGLLSFSSSLAQTMPAAGSGGIGGSTISGH